MPVYPNNPFSPPQLVQKGVPAYLFGSLNMLRGNTNLFLTNVALTTNVATVSVTILNGPKPQVNDLISIGNSTSTSGLFNVNRAIITGVTINDTTGAGTITFALTHANVTSAADSGSVITEVAEAGDAIANSSSVACLIQAPEGDSQFTVPMAVTFPGGVLPTAVTATLQVAIRDLDAEYTNTTTVVTVAGTAYTAGPVVQATLQRGYFYRIQLTGLTAGSATGVIAKIGG
jgi:hypothetical protein